METCDWFIVTVCLLYTKVTRVGADDDESNNRYRFYTYGFSNSPHSFYIWVIMGVILIVVAIICCVCCCKKQKQWTRGTSDGVTHSNPNNDVPTVYQNQVLDFSFTPYVYIPPGANPSTCALPHQSLQPGPLEQGNHPLLSTTGKITKPPSYDEVNIAPPPYTDIQVKEKAPAYTPTVASGMNSADVYSYDNQAAEEYGK